MIVITIALLLIVNLIFRAISYLFSENMERVGIFLLLLNTLRTWTKDGDVGVRSLDENRRTTLGEPCQAEGHRISPKPVTYTGIYKSDLANTDKRTLHDAWWRVTKVTRYLKRVSRRKRFQKLLRIRLTSPNDDLEASMPRRGPLGIRTPVNPRQERVATRTSISTPTSRAPSDQNTHKSTNQTIEDNKRTMLGSDTSDSTPRPVTPMAMYHFRMPRPGKGALLFDKMNVTEFLPRSEEQC
jgi:hypothetical protein